MYAGGAGARDQRTGGRVERPDPVVARRVALGRRVPLALFRDHVHQDRLLELLPDVAEGLDEVFQLVAGDRADVAEAEFLEEQARHDERLDRLLDALGHFGRLLADAGERAQELDELVAHPRRQVSGEHAVQIRGERPDVRGDRHLVVVEHDDQVLLEVPDVIERLEGLAGGHRAVADDRDDLVILPEGVARRRQPGRRRDARAAVPRAEDVVATLRAAGEPRDPAGLPQRAETLEAAGQQLVGVALVADVPDDPVARRREDRLERDGQLDDPEAGRQVPAGAGNRGDDDFANLGREPLLLLVREGGDRGRPRRSAPEAVRSR